MSNEKRIVDVDDLVGKVYFKIATWHNNEEGLNDQELQNRLVGTSKDVIELVLSTFFQDGKFASEVIENGVKKQTDSKPSLLDQLNNIDVSKHLK